MKSVARVVALVIALLMVLGMVAGAFPVFAYAAGPQMTVESEGSPSYCLDPENPVYVDLDRIKNTGYYYKIENLKLKLTLGTSTIDSITGITCSGGSLQVSTSYDSDAITKSWNSASQTLTLTLDHLLFDGNGTDLRMQIGYKTTDNATGILPISLQLSYLEPKTDSGSSKYTTDDPVSILTPRIIVEKYPHSGLVKKGEEFTVSLNYGTKSDLILKNIVLSVAPPAGVSIKNTSNKAYIDSLSDVDPKKSSFTFLVSDQYEDDTIPLTVNFDFEYWLDGLYTKGTSSEILSLAIEDKKTESDADRFELSTLTLPENLFANEEGWLTLNVINKGKKQASNVTVRLAGEGLSNNGQEEYYGAVASNTKAEIELPISASTGGEYNCQLIVTYENSDDELKELTKEFTLNVQEMDQSTMFPGYMEDPMGGDMPMEEPASGLSTPVLIAIIGAGVLVLVIVTVVVVKKRRKAKLAEVEDEDN